MVTEPVPKAALPHDPYIAAVVTVLSAVGAAPSEWWTDSGEENRHDEDGLACMLTATLVWDDEHPSLNTELYPHGIVLLWESPVEDWQWAPRKADGHLERDPEPIATMGRWSAPVAVAETSVALLTGRAAPAGYAPYWDEAAPVVEAVAAWEAAEQAKVDAYKAGGHG